MFTVGDVYMTLREFDAETPVCSSCFHPLNNYEGDDGHDMMCPNEMCLDETVYPCK